MFSTRIKILVGYALLAIVLLSATWMIYDNTANCREQRIGKTDGAKGHRGHSRVLNARNG